MKKKIVIDGSNIYDKISLYKEINLKFMKNEDWELSESLDAFNDLLYGGFGEIKGNEAIQLIWENFENNKKTFGNNFTLNFYQEKLKSPDIFNLKAIRQNIEDLKNGIGSTYMDMILDIIEDHPNIELIKS